MPFTVNDFHDLVELLERNPTWRAEMRRLVLSDELLKLPQELRELAQIVRELAETSKRNEARFVRIETDIGELKGRVTVIEGDVGVLKSDVGVLKSDMAEAKADIAVFKSDMAGAKADIAVLKNDVAHLRGSDLEWQVRERPYVYLSRFARRIRAMRDAELGDLIEDALDQERLTEAEAEEVKRLDAIARGLHRETNEPLYLAAEVSAVVNEYDVERAMKRAALLKKATGVMTMPVVVGKVIHQQIRTRVDAQQAGWVLLAD